MFEYIISILSPNNLVSRFPLPILTLFYTKLPNIFWNREFIANIAAKNMRVYFLQKEEKKSKGTRACYLNVAHFLPFPVASHKEAVQFCFSVSMFFIGADKHTNAILSTFKQRHGDHQVNVISILI